ncbi:PqqD family protein [Cytobacillus spongiae]|uniref:PqqD family protein n=1 Tax=Cytobacillus spongiae TaxID=2901381 RepID=UPI001F3FFC2B|nr:PqqD family protein [Cytobacillus spongiae]UII56733.1 PqqD family protein [Cytobacillus spongiae]
MTIEINLNTVVDCSHLSIQPDGDEYTIGDPHTGEFLRVPEVAVDVIKLLDGHSTITEATDILKKKYDDDIDVLDFASTLLEYKLVLSIDGEVLNPQVKREPSRVLVQLGRFFYSSPALILYSISFFIIIFLLFTQPKLTPHYKDIFVFQAIGLSTLNLMVVSYLLIAIHEFGHVLAAAKEQVISRVRLNLRMVFLVAETDMTGLWSRPKSKRYVPYLAGMAWDVVIILACLLMQLYSSNQLVIDYAKLIVYICIVKFIWQFIIYLRTDMYYVVSNWKNTSALHENGIMYLRKKFLKKETPLWNDLPKYEQKNAVWFGYLYLVGAFVAAGQFLLFRLPPSIYGITIVIKNVVANDFYSYYFWDSIIVLGVTLIQLVTWLLGFRTLWRERKERRAVAQA